MPLPTAAGTAQDRTMITPQDPNGHHRDHADRDITILAMIVAVVAIVIAAVALVLVLRDDNTPEAADTTTSSAITTTLPTTTEASATTEPTTTTTTEATTTTETQSTTSSTDTTDPDAYIGAVWPWPDAADGPAAQRFTDPVDAATRFAIDFVGFVDPVVGEFQQGDTRSGEVEIRNRTDGPPTTVFVRQLGIDDTWWVLGAASGNIMITQPEALEMLDGSLVVEGQARTFEGNVEVVLRADGLSDPLLIDTVTGRGDGVFGPFEETFAFEPPASDAGAALFIARSAEDGNVWEVGVVRVRFTE